KGTASPGARGTHGGSLGGPTPLGRWRNAGLTGNLAKPGRRERRAGRYLGRRLASTQGHENSVDVIVPRLVPRLVGGPQPPGSLRDSLKFVVHAQDDTANRLRLTRWLDSVIRMRNPIPQTVSEIHTTHCLRCGRPLRAASSVAAGYGRWCDEYNDGNDAGIAASMPIWRAGASSPLRLAGVPAS